MIKLILTDMDGTFLNSDQKISENAIETIKELQDRGIKFGVASGREYRDLLTFFPEVSKEMIFIANNGTLIYDCEEEIFADCFKKEHIKRLMQSLREVPECWIVLRGKEKTYLECKDPAQTEVIQYLLDHFYSIEIAEDALQMMKEDAIFEFSVYCTLGSQEILKRFGWMEEEFQTILWGDYWIDIFNHSSGKGNALKKILEKYGLDQSECMCFGDYVNDIDLLLNAGESYAMENALPQVKEIAKHIAPNHNENGVITVLRKYFELD